MPISAELTSYLETSRLVIDMLHEQLESSAELNQGVTVKGSVKDSYTEVQEEFLGQLKRLLEDYKKEAETTGFIKLQKNFSRLITNILSKIDETSPNHDQKDRIDAIKSLISLLLEASTKVAAKEVSSCFVVDIWTGGFAALIPLIPVIKENLSCLAGATLESLRTDGGYSPEDAIVVEHFIDAINKDSIDHAGLFEALQNFREQPLAFALLNDIINHGGGPSLRPPHKLILHCEIGVIAEAQVADNSRIEETDVRITTSSQLTALRNNFKNHMESVASCDLKILYVGLGHGGDNVAGGTDFRKEMSGIAGSEWEVVLKSLADQGTRAQYIIADSCYSAAFTKDFHPLLTPEGIMQLDLVENTPCYGLEASLRQACEAEPGCFYTSEEIENPENLANTLLYNLGKEISDELVKDVAAALMDILKDKEHDLTEADLRSNAHLNALLDDTNSAERTLDEVLEVSDHLPSSFNLWSYFSREERKPLAVDSIILLKEDVKRALVARGITEIEAIKLSSLYVETIKASIAILYGNPTPAWWPTTSSPYIPSKEMLVHGKKFASYGKLTPPALLVESTGDSLRQCLTELNRERIQATGKIVMTKTDIYAPDLTVRPDNCSDVWKEEARINLSLVTDAYPEGGRCTINPSGQRGVLTKVNTCGTGAGAAIITLST